MTLLDIIAGSSAAAVAAQLGVTPSYISKVKTGEKPISAALLARAKGCYGDLFDVEKTLIELRAEDYERGQASASPPSPPPDSHPTPEL